MADVAPYGWQATTAAGLVSLFTGGLPDASGFASVAPLADEAAYEAAMLALRFPNTPPTAADLAVYAKAKLGAFLAAGKTFNVATSGAALNILCDGSSDTRADLAMLILDGQENPTATSPWVDNTGATTMLTGEQFVTLGKLAGAWIIGGYGILGSTLAAILATPPTITATAQIDTAFTAIA